MPVLIVITNAGFVMDDKLSELECDLQRLKQYYPYRIIWGYIDENNENHCFASKTKHGMNKAVREGKTVYKL